MASIWDFLDSIPRRGDVSPEELAARRQGYADLYAGGFLSRNSDQMPLSVQGAQAAQDFIPGIGDAIALGEAGQALSRGELAAAGLLGTGALVGLVPGAGDALARPIMAAGRKVADAIPSDAIYAGRSLAEGDMRGVLDAFAPSRPAQGLGADAVMQRGMGDNGGPRLANPLKADLDPLGYQKVKMDNYLKDTDVGITDTGVNLERTPMSWEDMEGDFVIPFYGDRTSGGMNVSSVNDIKFDRDVYTDGGLDYMRGPAAQADDAIWASNSNITKRLADAADKIALLYPDRRIVGMTGSMSPDANDFATMTGGSVGEIVQQLGVPSKTAAEFDEIMRAADPDFVGVNSPNLRQWLETTTSPRRKTFIRLADTKPMKDGGFPDMALGRYAVTDPTQRDLPPGMFGMGAAQIDTSAPRAFNNPKGNQPRVNVPHRTYNSIIKGDYLGSLPPVPQGLLFRDIYDRMEGKLTKAGKPLTSAHKTHAIKTIVPAQEITPQVLEGILDYVARLPR